MNTFSLRPKIYKYTATGWTRPSGLGCLSKRLVNALDFALSNLDGAGEGI